MTLSVFPVANHPSVHYTNDYGYERADGRRHQGIDIFADEGIPILAPDDGTVRFSEDPLGGLVFSHTDDLGVRIYGAHLARTEGASGRRVRAGQVIGYVGRTGNAAHTAPHLHLEVRPPGSGPVNPYPLLQAAERRGVPGGGLAPWIMLAGAAAGIYFLSRTLQGRRIGFA